MAETLPPDALSKLIGSIYDCTLDPGRWERTLIELAQVFEAEFLILSLNDLRHDCLVIDKSVGWEPLWLEERSKHLPEIHARVTEWLTPGTSLDEPFVASRHLEPSYLNSAPYVRDCLRPLGIADVTHLFLMHTPTHFSELVIARHQRQGIITEREIAIGKLLLPHLRRAVTISNVLEARIIERARMAEALDTIRCGVVLTDERGAILHLNRSAQRMLRNGGPVRDVQGFLKATSPSAAKELRSAIRLAAGDEARIGKTGLAIRLTEADAPPVFAHVLPMTGDLRTQLQSEAVAAVFIGAIPDEQNEAEMLAKAFGLTPAETRVLASLLAGRTLAETATALGVAATTVRTHLSSIFLKTGVCRQAELMRLAMHVRPC
jgi:DNA-binding CsgD family transcriptional regulator/PAS domain-containing protein